MIHIKLFENFKDYFTEINKTEYEGKETIVGNIIIPFTKSELDTIQKIVPVPIEPDKYNTDQIFFKIKSFIYNNLVRKHELMYIYKSKDEFFYVRISKEGKSRSYYYKCDQLEGLLKFISTSVKF
jgi:hypothetical protein